MAQHNPVRCHRGYVSGPDFLGSMSYKEHVFPQSNYNCQGVTGWPGCSWGVDFPLNPAVVATTPFFYKSISSIWAVSQLPFPFSLMKHVQKIMYQCISSTSLYFILCHYKYFYICQDFSIIQCFS